MPPDTPSSFSWVRFSIDPEDQDALAHLLRARGRADVNNTQRVEAGKLSQAF